MNTAHTPGPWDIVNAPNGKTYIKDKDRAILAVIYGDNTLTVGDTSANAALIAAAPELLEALRTIVANSASVQMGPQWAVQVARNAIIRVKGWA